MSKWLKLVIFIVASTGFFAVVGHVLNIQPPPGVVGPPGATWFSEHIPRYEQEKLYGYSHLICAILFILIFPIQFSKKIRLKSLTFHRWLGRLFVLISAIAGATGLALGIVIPFAGVTETYVTFLWPLSFSIR